MTAPQYAQLEIITAEVAADRLENAVREALQFTGVASPLRLLVSPLDIAFERPVDGAAGLPAELDQAILFGETGQVELREIVPGTYRVVAFRDSVGAAKWSNTPGGVFGPPAVVQLVAPTEDEFYLWGRFTPELDGWHEGRIQKVLHYPWSIAGTPPDRLRLLAAIYRDVETRQPLYVLWRGLRPVSLSDPEIELMEQ